ncbi:nuclear pore complex protein NUP58-like [Triticum urartu]|nr:nuclear pore complex protein NUP58-like [Triticum urartu]
MSRLDGNTDLDGVARRLSFSSASPGQLPPLPPRTSRRQPALPPIAEDPREQQSASTATTQTPPSSQAPRATTRGRFTVYTEAPPSVPHTQAAPVPPAPSTSPLETHQATPVAPAASTSSLQTLQAVAAALGRLEQQRQAGLQQASVAAQQQQAFVAAYEGWERGRQAGLQQQPWAHQAWAQPQAEQQVRLYTAEGEPAGYATKWEELHPVSQHLLLQIEDKIRDERPACEQVEQCRRLSDPSVSNKGFELDARQITQEIGLISTIIDREKASIQSLMADVREIVSHVDFAICAYGKVRQRFVSEGAALAYCAGSSSAPTDFSHHSTMARTFRNCYASVYRPSLFMQHIVERFEKQLEECCKLIGELEQLVKTKNDKTHPGSLKSLPKVMSNVHDYLIFVASKVENLHQHAETIRTQYLNDLRNSGNWNDPFVEADRKEAAKQEAAARIVHPTLPVTSGNTRSRRQMCS